MRSWLSAALIAFIGLSSAAFAEPFGVRQETVLKNGDRSETIVFAAENEEDREKIVASLRDILKADFRKHSDLLTSFHIVSAQKGRSPSEVDPSEEAVRKSLNEVADGREVTQSFLDEATRIAVRKNFSTWFDRHYRVCFTLVRTANTTAVTTWSLIASDHIPFPIALSTGVIMGSVSGAMQYWNKDFQTYLKKSFSHRIKNKFLANANKKIAPFSRWMLLEDGFIAALQITLSAFGYPPSDSVPKFLKENILSSLYTVASQGVSDVVVAKETEFQSKEAVVLHSDGKLNETELQTSLTRIQLRSDLITLGISAISVGTMVANIMDVPHIWTAYVAMGAGGGLYGYRVKIGNYCRKLLGRTENSGTP